MEETEDEIDSNIFQSSAKKYKSRSSKNNSIFKKGCLQLKEKFHLSSIKKIFNQGITSKQPINMFITSNNSIKHLPILSSVSKNVNKDDFLIINEEMKINKNILENNLFNLLNKVKNKKKNFNRKLFSSFIKESSIKEPDSVGTEEQKSVDIYNNEMVSPRYNAEIKRKNNSLSNRSNKKYKFKTSNKKHKKPISLIKILNKPFCFISSRGKNNLILNNEERKILSNNNGLIDNDYKTPNNRYSNINVVNNKKLERVSFYKVNNIFNERVKSGLIKLNTPNQNKKNIEMNLNKNNSAKNIGGYTHDLFYRITQSSFYQFKLNLLRNKICNRPSQFSIYHFFESHNIYIFIKNSKYTSKIPIDIYSSFVGKNQNHSEKNKLYEIEEDFFLPGAYRPRMNKWQKMPQCIENTCKRGGIELIKNLDNCNVIWKLMHSNKMRELVRLINKNQKYNHFPSTFQLGRKDNLYKHIKSFKKLFHNLYNFLPSTYLIPSEAKEFENAFRKYKKNLWIVKPVNLSRGRGVHILRGESEFKSLYKKGKNSYNNSQILISRYIDKPHIINKKKYDLRIYVLIVSFSPLRIYLYNNGLTRFATEDYKRGDFDNIYIHLTNYSINKNNLKYKPNQNISNSEYTKIKNISGEENEENEEDEDCEFEENYSKWSLNEYRQYFKKEGKEKIMDKIWKQIEDIVIKTVLTINEDYYKEVSLNKINSLFELYGFDILIDEKYKAWLIEVNINPSLHCTSPLDLNIKTDLITDILNVVGITPYNHNNGETIFNYLMKKTKIDFDINNEFFPKLRLTKSNFFDSYNDIDSHININQNNNSMNNISLVSSNNNNLMLLKSTVLKNFNQKNLKQKFPEYDNEYYKKIIENFVEERARSEMTDFKLIFPIKDNIPTYSDIIIKSNTLNDSNIVLWSYILNEKN